MKPDRPNIVLINVDQWRGDCLGSAGHPVVETPHLDRLAAEGVSFSRAYAAVPSCIAARASMMTGLTPASHGRVGYRDGVPWNYDVTLAGLFAGAGYHTQAVGKMHVYPQRTLLGFHNVVLHDGYLHVSRSDPHNIERLDDYLPWLRSKYGPAADYTDTGLGCNGYVVRPWVYDDMDHPSAWVTTQSIDFLRRRDPRRPFLLFASYHRPHPPLDPPRDYLEMYRDAPLPPLPVGDWTRSFDALQRGVDSPCPGRMPEIERARRAYYAQLTFIDHQINRLTHALHEHGVLQNTCFLFCSDHGDMLYDHHLVAKALPYEGSARIPFFLRFPPQWGMNRESIVDAPVELRDVLPTLCDVAGIDCPDTVEGRSLLPFCRGENPAWRPYVHGEHSGGARSNHWLTDGTMKYVWYSQSGREQLFNLEDDPEERHDLVAKEAEQVESWRASLICELEGREEGYVDDGKLIAGRTPQATLSFLDADTNA
jgi:arylsulfatase A-like enzyme